MGVGRDRLAFITPYKIEPTHFHFHSFLSLFARLITHFGTSPYMFSQPYPLPSHILPTLNPLPPPIKSSKHLHFPPATDSLCGPNLEVHAAP